MKRLGLLLILVLAGQADAAGVVPQQLRGQIRARASLYDLSFTLDPSKAALDAGFWVGFAMDKRGRGYAAWVGRSGVRLFERNAGGSRELGRAALPKGYWSAPKRTLRVAVRPRRVFVCIDARRFLQARADQPPGDYIGVLGLAKAALVSGPQVQKRARPRFTDDFASPKSVAEAWSVEAGQWRLEAPVDPLIALNENTPMYSLYTASGERCVATAGYASWDFYAVEATCNLRGGTQCGLVLYWQDQANHAALVLHKDKKDSLARLQWVRQGKQHSVSSRLRFDAPQWHRLRVEALDDQVWGYVDGRLAVTGRDIGLHQGKVGVCAAGSGAGFDDVTVEPFDAMMLGPPESSVLPRIWPGVRLRAWADPALPVAVTLQDKRRALTLETKPKDKRSVLSIMAGAGRVVGRKCLALAQAPRAPAPVDLSSCRGAVWATVGGKRMGLWHGEKFAPALAAFSGQGTWARVEPWEPKPALVYENRFDSPMTRSKLSRQPRPVIGHDLHPSQARWLIAPDATGDGRVSVRGKEAASLGYANPCPGDVKLSVDVLAMTKGAAVRIAGEQAGSDDGYAACLVRSEQGFRLSLRRGAKAIGEKTIQAAAIRLPCRLSVERDCDYVVAEVGEAHRLVCRDAAPLLGEYVSIASLGGPCVFDNLRIENLTAFHYTFERISPAWREASGGFMLHSGLSCIPWDYWLTADGRKTPAVLWHREELPADLAVQFDVSEITIGTDDPDVTHYHFPYHDVTLAVCADGSDLQSGYAIEIGADRGACARIRKRGKILFETYDFTITMGDHCNTPRQVQVYLRKLGQRLTLAFNSAPIADIHDPDPLPGGSLALAVKDCRANFSDVLIMPETTRAKGP